MVSLKLIRHKCERLLRLSGEERWILFQAAWLMLIIAGGRRVMSLKQLQAWLLVRILPLSIHQPHPTANRIAGLVQISAAHLPARPNCLARSLALQTLLHRRGIPAELRLGVRKEGQHFEAHAWVEFDGQVLNDSADVHTRFTAFPSRHGIPGMFSK
jgi:hypothetical protein